MKTHLLARTVVLQSSMVWLITLGWTVAIQAQPPGGPPIGGMIMMGGGPWGGDRGGDRGDRGDRGGDRGRGGWGGGGFDPSQFISRMDTNGNGALDPEEVQGPARFMLERMARNNPKIDISKPIPISVLTESIQQMRGGSSSGGGSWGSSWGGFGTEEDNVDTPSQSLVPGFGVAIERAPVPGFGSAGALSAIQVDERDRRDADERMRRYDKNNDGSLDEEEIKEARWNDSLSQWDRNRDGKLSRDEVAARYARRREQRQNQESNTRGSEENRGRQQASTDGDKKAPTRPFEKTASFRLKGSDGGPTRPAGLPEWFVRDDADGDNQVAMSEFARKWDASTLEDFAKFDVNDDGYITAKECLAGVKKGYLKGSSSSTSTASAKPESSEPTTAPKASVASGVAAKPAPNAGSSGEMKAEMIDWSRKNLAKKDKDKNGFLTPDEFSDSSTQFGDVDSDGNGQISVEEYAAYRMNRSKK